MNSVSLRERSLEKEVIQKKKKSGRELQTVRCESFVPEAENDHLIQIKTSPLEMSHPVAATFGYGFASNSHCSFVLVCRFFTR